MTTNVTGARKKRGGGRRRRKGGERRDSPFRRRAHSEMRRFFSRNILSRSAPSHASRFVSCNAVYTPRTGISFPDSRFPIFPRFLPFWRRGRGRRQSRAIPPVKRNSLFAGGGVGRGGEQKRATGTRGDGLPRIFNFVPPPRGEYLYACSSRGGAHVERSPWGQFGGRKRRKRWRRRKERGLSPFSISLSFPPLPKWVWRIGPSVSTGRKGDRKSPTFPLGYCSGSQVFIHSRKRNVFCH